MNRIVPLIVCLALACTPLCAHDLLPPDWRGEPRSTLQIWEYFTPELYDPATVDSNAYGTPVAKPDSWNPWSFTGNFLGPCCGGTWPGGWYIGGTDDYGGSIILELPNAPEMPDEKWFRVQITSTRVPYTNYGFSVELGTNYWHPENTFTWVTNWNCSNWVTHVSDWTIGYNPSQEIMYLDFPSDTIVAQIACDTWCTPEPVAVIALGLCVLLARRRSQALH